MKRVLNMAKLHFRPEEAQNRLEPYEIGLKYTSVQRLKCDGKTILVQSADEETCLVVAEGEIRYKATDHSGTAGICDMVYLPVNGGAELSGSGIVMRYGAPCSRKTQFAFIPFREVDADPERHKVYGSSEQGTRRDVWNFIDEKFDSSRFLVGICYGASGGWTAWPPHEHGEKREEVYTYFGMQDGFGLQCVYTEMGRPDQVSLVQNGDVISIAGGYHPNVGCPKTGIRYIFCMVSIVPEDRRFMDLSTQLIYGDRLE